MWRERLAVPWTGGPATPPEVRRPAADVRDRAERLLVTDLPADSCWILHQLPLDRVAPDFLILSYRDPRDAFRHDRIGRWQEHFTARHGERFAAGYGNLPDLYGYR